MQEVKSPVLDIASGQGIDRQCESQQKKGPVGVPEPSSICESRGVTEDQWVHETEEKNPVTAFQDSFKKRHMAALKEIEHRYPNQNKSYSEGFKIQDLQ